MKLLQGIDDTEEGEIPDVEEGEVQSGDDEPKPSKAASIAALTSLLKQVYYNIPNVCTAPDSGKIFKELSKFGKSSFACLITINKLDLLRPFKFSC